MVVTEEDMLDARVDITKDHVEQWRRRRRDFDLGLRRVQQSLRCIRLWPDEHDLLGARIDIDQYRRAIDQVALDFITRPSQAGRDAVLVGSNFRSAGLAGRAVGSVNDGMGCDVRGDCRGRGGKPRGVDKS